MKRDKKGRLITQIKNDINLLNKTKKLPRMVANDIKQLTIEKRIITKLEEFIE